MDRDLFEHRFIQAATAARDHARALVEESLPDAMLFDVHLNSSHDANASADFTLFPEDSSSPSRAHRMELTAPEVVALLWRDGLVPQWVDVMVVGETHDETILEVIACGRFIADESRLYATPRGQDAQGTSYAPFSPKALVPMDYVKGQRFSIYKR